MIITLDTGILARASFRSDGPARRLLQEIASRPQHVLALSPFILGELGQTLAYSPVADRLRLTPEEIHDHLTFLRRVARIVEPPRGLPVVLTDPDDDPIIYTAVGAGANVLCTRDRAFYTNHVLTFCRSYSIDVMDDLQLLAILVQS